MADHNMNPSFQLGELDPEFIDHSNPYAYSPLFDPHNVDDTHPSQSQSHPSQTSHATTSTTSTAKRPRKKTSKVWEHFEEERVVSGGVVEIKAKCKWHGCPSVLSMQSKGGTGSLQRHIDTHMKKDEKAAAFSSRVQSTLQYNPDGSVRNWTYDPALQRESLCRLIASNDLPLGFGESEAFVEYIQTSQNPNFRPVSRQTTSRDMRKLCKKNLAKIKEDFIDCTFSVALTSDIWSGRAKQDYISVVAHYVDEKWQLQKRVIGFELIDVSHSGLNISNAITKVVHDFALTSNFFAITMDNASANSNAMNYLTPIFDQYAAPYLMHQRCACHIINLIAKCALKKVHDEIEVLRTAITFLISDNGRIANYERYCIALGTIAHGYSLDMPIRWNSTYMMLKSLIKDRVSFTGFINAAYGYEALTPQIWHITEHLTKKLELFYDYTITLSGVYYPTSPMMVHVIIEIATHLKSYEDDFILQTTVYRMKRKFEKYWTEIPPLYAFAFILDPRAKTEGCGNALSLLTEAVGKNYDESYGPYFTDIRDKLSTLFGKYEEKYGARVQRPPPAPISGRGKGLWSKIYRGSSSTSSSSGRTTPVLAGDGELAKYLNSPVVPYADPESENEESAFNILQWWQDHKLTYPVLSILARDVLSVPVSTVSSESAFSLAGRIINDRRTCLTPDMVRTVMTVKDAELARRRGQHTAENQELAATFYDLALHEEEDPE